MTGELFLSRFTPSMMSPDVLEKVFVQRGDLATRIVELVEESVRTPAKHHTLIVGPRGSGKTHLLALAHNRLDAKEDLRDRIRIAWLREEEWGVASFLDFLFRILRALAASYGDEELRRETEQLFEMPLKSAERRAGELLREFIDGRVLLVITENVDALFQGLQKKGQQRLRAYLQEEQSWTILGSAQALFAGVTLHASPFYGFFDIHHLQELTVDDAARLVRNIAELSGDADLAAYVQSDEGRARIRAVHHLAGGNHRVYIILSEFLTRESLDQLVGPFMRMMDDLTPYYQAKMEQLSPQQRKIIDLLCSVRGAVPVKEIAKRCFITPQTASSQLKDLRERGFVESTPIGRDAYYEIAEPLMRLALEVKHQRNETIGLFLDFLRHWYAPQELARLLESTSSDASIERHYLEVALRDALVEDANPRVGKMLQEFRERATSDDWTAATVLAEQLVQERGAVEDWSHLAHCFLNIDRFEEALVASQRAISIDAEYAHAWRLVVAAHLCQGNHDSALVAAERGVILNAHSPYSHGAHAFALQHSSRYEEALAAWDRAISAAPDHIPSWRGKRDLLLDLQRYADALEVIDTTIARSGAYSQADRLRRGEILNRLRRFAEALDDVSHVLAMDPENVSALVAHSIALLGAGDSDGAVADLQRAHSLVPTNDRVTASLTILLLDLGRASGVLTMLDKAIATSGDSAILLGLRVQALAMLGSYDEAVSEMDRWLSTSGAGETVQYVTYAVIDALQTGACDQLESLVHEILVTYKRHAFDGALGAAIAYSTSNVLWKGIAIDAARAWVDAWSAATEGTISLTIPVQLLSAVLEYRETGDRRVLLRLPIEVRQLAEELFDASGPAEAPAGD